MADNFSLKEINRRAEADPAGFVAECDEAFHQNVVKAADQIIEHMKVSPLVLLSGPSGSGKTTTAKKIEEELRSRGVTTHTISLDDYFIDVDHTTHPRDIWGNIDYESPYCLDLELLREHFRDLSNGRAVLVPRFNFVKQERDYERSSPLMLGKDEVAIFEGIHALNDLISGEFGNLAKKVYISARSDTELDGRVVFKGTWIRLVRRLVRDLSYRGTSATRTMSMWASVRRGEKSYISPFKHRADIIFNSALPYEIPVFRNIAMRLFEEVPDCERKKEIEQIGPALELFYPIDEKYVSRDSLIREFIGGGSYVY